MLRHIDSLRSAQTASSNTSQAVKSAQQPAPSASTAQPKTPSAKTTVVKPPVVPVGVDRTEVIKGFKKAMAKSMTTALVKSILRS